MAGFGGRTRVSRKLDLVNGEGSDGRMPGPRGHAVDVVTALADSIGLKALQVARVIEGRAGSSDSVGYRWCAYAALTPPSVALLLCLVAGLHGSVAAFVCAGVLAVSAGPAVAVFRGARRARRRHVAEVERERLERAREQQAAKTVTFRNKRKMAQGTRRGRGGGGAGGGRSPRGRRA